MPTAILPTPPNQPTSIHDLLVGYIGGQPEQVRVRNPDHLRIFVDLAPLMMIAGGAWAECAARAQDGNA